MALSSVSVGYELIAFAALRQMNPTNVAPKRGEEMSETIYTVKGRS